jgi:hypothetical protein
MRSPRRSARTTTRQSRRSSAPAGAISFPATRPTRTICVAASLWLGDQSHKLVPQGDDKMLIEAGTTGWLGPIPIVKDAAAGATTSRLASRKSSPAKSGATNSRSTLLAIVDAQRDYVTLDPMKTGAPTYARRLLSSPGKKDGLYWEAKPGEPESPLGALVATAQPGDRPGEGYFGYHFPMLYGQGAAAPGGAYSYLVNGRMVGRFGVIAWPVSYGETGVMTFMVSQSGDVYEKDLGPETPAKAAAIILFDPDKTWDKADIPRHRARTSCQSGSSAVAFSFRTR